MDNIFQNLVEIKGGLSKKIIFRKSEKKINKIIIDFSKDISHFYKFLNIYKILNNINVSIPKIYEVHKNKLTIIMEDFGEKKIDKIINEKNYYSLIKSSVDCLIVIHNTVTNDDLVNLNKYTFRELKNEISEFIKYFIPFEKIENFPIEQFFKVWQIAYEDQKFYFSSFVHKDYEFINLFFLKNNNSHLEIGIIDFQSAFNGFIGWDLFSILENPRINFTRKYNEELISFFYNNISTQLEFYIFRQQYYLLNLARQTRLLGRWSKLIIEKNNNVYKDFITVTLNKLLVCLENLDNNDLKLVYKKILALK